jgi:hypothetical protein
MDLKEITKKICLKPVVNKKNGQFNFSLKKNQLPKEVKLRLPRLKSISIKMEDFEYY